MCGEGETGDDADDGVDSNDAGVDSAVLTVLLLLL